jgi:hypothetical protein
MFYFLLFANSNSIAKTNSISKVDIHQGLRIQIQDKLTILNIFSGIQTSTMTIDKHPMALVYLFSIRCNSPAFLLATGRILFVV